jgi:hypothetical protein
MPFSRSLKGSDYAELFELSPRLADDLGGQLGITRDSA